MLKTRAVCSSLLLIIASLGTALGQTEIAKNDRCSGRARAAGRFSIHRADSIGSI